ncbi:MAG: hypothetical protein QOF02_1180 [Blastocatellia bacterium]|jgi:hypothetical protein|nr:hypothetical protein [Blastocatellia bacterium]
MNRLKVMITISFVVVFAFTATFTNSVSSQKGGQESRSPVDGKTRRERFSHNGALRNEDAPKVDNGQSTTRSKNDLIGKVKEALTGFDNLTNGYTEQGPPFETLNEDNVVALRSHNDNRFIYEEFEKVEDGVGPTYNAQSCRECHQNVVTGGASQVTVQRTGRTENGEFFESMGGSLIHSRATYPDIVELVAFADTTRTFRISPGTLGDGYIEAIANSTLLTIRDSQPANLRGNAVMVPVLEGTGEARIGRFGWKSQHASLVSFAVDAYLNEMGITTPLLPEENTSSGHFVGYGSEYDPLPEPEDDGADANAFADFMRATKAPSRGDITLDALAGERLFKQVGCSVCHVASITTASPGSLINGGALLVPEALGNKIIHPYSDFLLHDIGTGDGIPIQPTPEYAATANQIRTAPLWGLRTRNRLMHDGLTFTLQEAIQRHAGQAASVTSAYNALPTAQKNQILAFLNSL